MLSLLTKLHVLIILGLLLSGCNTMQRIQNSELMEDFDETFFLYSKHLRWGHFRQVTTFMTPERIGPAMDQIDTFKDIRVSKVQPITWILNSEEETIKGEIVVDYYIVSRSVIRSTSQKQTWRYINDTWKLDTGFPDLK